MKDNLCPVCGSIKIENKHPNTKLEAMRFIKCRKLCERPKFCEVCGLCFLENQYFGEPLYNGDKEMNVYAKSKVGLFNYGLKVLNSCFPQKGNLLDIGAAYGDFMEFGLKDGWQVEGIEIANKMVQKAKRKSLKVYDKPIEELNLKSNYYNAITVYEVLCLMKDPKRAVIEMYKVLKPGGVLFIREFNAAFHVNLSGFCDLKLFSVLNLNPCIIHNFNFNSRSLNIILKQAGFKDIKIINSKPTLGDPYGTGGKLGRFFVSVFKSVYYIFSQIAWFLSFGKIYTGSSLIVTARKR
ncbi:MAG: class I SAM-dependent methyltransferase [Elusimicrobia bacterium]|nr:class I SAM-dependent methyltransferase [Elusimicrobiota bacterium]